MKKDQEMAGEMSGASNELSKLECLYHLAKAPGFVYTNSSWISVHVLEFMYSKSFSMSFLVYVIYVLLLLQCSHVGFNWNLISVGTY